MDKRDFMLRFCKENQPIKEQLKSVKITQPPQEQITILKDPNLFGIIDKEFQKKITGEEKSRKAIFLSLCSIWLEDLEIPLNTLVSSESSAGKSYICKQIIKIFPRYLVESRSKISPEAFSYWHTNEEDWTWDGKICYLNEISQVLLDSTTFKVMCSDETAGTIVRNHKAVDLFIDGKPCMLVTTATTNPTTEVLNRFQIIQLDESKEQTQRITWEQALDCKKEPYDQKIIDSLSYLERYNVFVPFAPHIHVYLTKFYSWDDVRMRRDFPRLISLIKCSAVLHQFQREKNEKGELIATEQDYEIAKKVINYVQTTTLKGLTHKLRKAYDFCLKEKEFRAGDIHSKHPFVSLQMWYDYLDDLCERGLLKTELRTIEESKKRVTFYSVPESTTFNLPSFEELCRNSLIDLNGSIVSNDLIDLNDGINSSNSINSTSKVSGKVTDSDNSKPEIEIIKIKNTE